MDPRKWRVSWEPGNHQITTGKPQINPESDLVRVPPWVAGNSDLSLALSLFLPPSLPLSLPGTKHPPHHTGANTPLGSASESPWRRRILALSQPLFAHQFGKTGLFPAAKSTKLCRKPSTSTWDQAVDPSEAAPGTATLKATWKRCLPWKSPTIIFPSPPVSNVPLFPKSSAQVSPNVHPASSRRPQGGRVKVGDQERSGFDERNVVCVGVQGLGLRIGVRGLGVGGWGLGVGGWSFRMSGWGFRVSGFGFRVGRGCGAVAGTPA